MHVRKQITDKHKLIAPFLFRLVFLGYKPTGTYVRMSNNGLEDDLYFDSKLPVREICYV